MRFKSLWSFVTHLSIQGEFNLTADALGKVFEDANLQAHLNSKQHASLLLIEFESPNGILEEAYLQAVDLANETFDYVSCAITTPIYHSKHLFTCCHVVKEEKFDVLSTTSSNLAAYGTWILDNKTNILVVNDNQKSARRLLRDATNSLWKREALFYIYRALEVLAKEEAETIKSTCRHCNHTYDTGRKATKNTIIAWLIEKGVKTEVAQKFAGKTRNIIAHESGLITNQEEEELTEMYMHVFPRAIALIRQKTGVENIVGESFNCIRPVVIYECKFIDQSEDITFQIKSYQNKVSMMVSTEKPKLQITQEFGLDQRVLMPNWLEPYILHLRPQRL